MGIKRWVASKDTTITNAFEQNLRTRGTGSNMGASDSLEVFSIYGQATTGSANSRSSELSRILIQFPMTDISSSRESGDIPASGSVSFYLKMYNATHPYTVPEDYTLSVHALTSSWEEGIGLDMETYKDKTYDDTGANWVNARKGRSWETVGGDYATSNTITALDYTMPRKDQADLSSSFEASFSDGPEDLEVDITTLAEQWINTGGSGDKGDGGNADVLGSKSNYGVIIKLSSSQETYFSASSTAAISLDPGYHNLSGTAVFHHLNGAKRSYYTKKFFARGTQYFYNRPVLEARWNSSKQDDRGNFYLSSSLMTGDFIFIQLCSRPTKKYPRINRRRRWQRQNIC